MRSNSCFASRCAFAERPSNDLSLSFFSRRVVFSSCSCWRSGGGDGDVIFVVGILVAVDAF